MSPSIALLHRALLTRDSLLLWLFWLTLLGVAVLIANHGARSILTAPLTLAFPTLFVGWQFGSRLWQLDREAVRGLMPGRSAALRRAALLSVALFVLLPASLLWIRGADFSLSIAMLSAALFTGAFFPMMPLFAAPLMVVVVMPWMSRYGGSLAGIDGLGYTTIFTLLAVAALLGMLKRWQPLQSEQQGDAGLLTPLVLSPYADGRHSSGEAALTMHGWWQERGNAANIVLGDAGPRRPARALAILLGPPLAPLRAVARLRDASWFLLIVAVMAVVSEDPAKAAADLLPLFAIMLTLIIGLQGLLRMRYEWRNGGALFAEARLLPGLEPDNGAWQRLLGMLLARLLSFAAVGSLLILATGWFRPEYTQAHALALVPPWLALICVLLLPAVIAGRGLHLVAWAVLAGVNLLAVIASALAWGGRLDALDPMLWPSYGIGLSAIAALAGFIGWLAGGRRHSPFLAR